MRVLDRFINRKTVTIITILGALLLMAPIIYCGFFDYANGDDLIGAAPAHRAFVSGVSFFDYFKTVIDATIENYYNWDGNFASTFVWYAFEPSIFNENLYKIVPFIAFVCIGAGMIYASIHFGRKYLKMSLSPILTISISVLVYIVQFAPSIKALLFWWTGIVSYIFPIGLGWLSLIWVDKYWESQRIRYIVFTSFAMIFIGGAGFFTAILTIEVFALAFLWRIVISKKKFKDSVGLLIPFAILTICFLISYIAPGNSARAAVEGTNISLSFERIISTIFDCIVIGGKDVFVRLFEIRPLFLLIIIVVLLTWYFLDFEKCELQFKHPLIVIGILFLLYCSVYAPMIFAGTDVSGGGPDDIFIVFLVNMCISLIYLVGNIKRRLYTTEADNRFLNVVFIKKYVGIPTFIFILLFLIVCWKFLIGNSSGYMCYNFIKTGQLRDFDNQMKERIAILQSEEKNVILPQMNDEQGPFMHMPLTEDPSSYTNQTVQLFYLKDSVIAIPRDEWNEKYGGQ